MRLKTIVMCICLTTSFGTNCHADLVTQWNFNSSPADGNTGTGTLTPNVGSGTASLFGGTTAMFNGGNGDGNSSDPAAAADDSAWGVTTFPTVNSANETRGVQFTTSTVGFENITFSFDTRHSASASRYMAVYYTTDGTNYTRFSVNSGNANPGTTPSGGSPGSTPGLFGSNGTFSAFDNTVTGAGDDWFNGRTVNLSLIPAANNNPNFGFRLVSSFDSGTSYQPSGGTNYGAGGTWRFDFVQVNGSPIQAVPEPSVFLFGGALSLVLGGGAYARRKLARKSA